MIKITIASGNILSFQGDALICFCDSDLTCKKSNPILQVFDRNTQAHDSCQEVIDQSFSRNKEYEDNLVKELTSIGYCALGNAVIAQGLGLRVKNLIFVPYVNHNDPQDAFSYVLFHQALRSALNLAVVYNAKTLAIPILRNKIPKGEFINKIFSGIFETKQRESLSEEETWNITTAIVREFDNQSIQEVFVYR